MEEDKEDAERHYVADADKPNAEERPVDCTTIGKFVADSITRYKPPHHDAGEKGTCWQHDLSCEEVAEIHERHVKEPYARNSTNGKGTEHGNYAAHYGEYRCGLSARQFHLFVEEGGAYLVHGDGRCQGGKHQ